MNKEKTANSNAITACLDIVSIIGDSFVVTGWVAHQSKSEYELSFEYKEGAKAKIAKYYKGDRPDVLLHLSTQGKNSKLGFTSIQKMKDNEIPDNLLISFGKETHAIALKFKSNITLQEVLSAIIPYTKKEKTAIVIATMGIQYPNEDVRKLNALTSNSEFQIRHYIENIFYLEKGFFIYGWIDDLTIDIAYVFIESDGVYSENLYHKLERRHRPDVNAELDLEDDYKAGMYGYVPFSNYKEGEELKIVFLNSDGDMTHFPLSPTKLSANVIETTQYILHNVNIHSNRYLKAFENHIHTALTELWADKIKPPKEVKVKEYGVSPQKPVVSIVIPIYGRFDFVRFQNAIFARDPEFKNVEIIYVLDDPPISTMMHAYCKDVHDLFRLPFKVVSYEKNLGFAGSNNVGVEQAQSDLVLLLNSDVMPKDKGWLMKLIKSFEELDNVGVMGAKLLYEDLSIQHNGMVSEYSDYWGIWLNEHPGKGFPNWMDSKPGVKKMDLITGACMLFKKAVYQKAGGLCTDFLLGDFEDSYLCYWLIENGYTNYINSAIELYHLERQSQDLIGGGDWKFILTLYNGWQHSKKVKSLSRTES